MKSFPVGSSRLPEMPPEDFFQEICFDNRGFDAFQRPSFHHVFECRVHPAFDETFIDRILDIATGCTDGMIGFIRSKNSRFNLLIGIDNTKNHKLADTSKTIDNHCIKAGEILYSTDQYIHDPQPLLHELGHMMGLYHVQPPWNPRGLHIMGGAELSQDSYHSDEKLAVKRLFATPLPGEK